MTQLAFSDKSLAQAPNSNALALFLDGADGIIKVKDIRGVVAPLSDYVSGGGGGAVWGQITGNLSNQTDLQDALDLKADLSYVNDELSLKADADAVVLLTTDQDISGVKNFETRVGIGSGLTPDLNSLLHIDGGASVNRVIMDADNNVARIFSFRTDNSQRWAFRVDGNETGTEGVGADFQIRRYANAGTFVDAPISINRQTGVANILKFPTIGSSGTYYPSISVGNYTGASAIVTATSFTSPTGFNFFVATTDLRNGSTISVTAIYVSSGAGTGQRSIGFSVNSASATNGIVQNFTNVQFPAGRHYILMYSFYYYDGQLFAGSSSTWNGYAQTGASGTYVGYNPSGGGFTIYIGGLGADATSNVMIQGFKGVLNY